MKSLFLSIFVVCFILHNNSFGQTEPTSQDLVKQGVALNDAGKFDEAINKYKQALTVDPDNWRADYEMGYTLYNTGHGKEAIPYLQKILSAKDAAKYEVYDMLGSIYDDIKESQKAVEYYKNGIADNPDFEHLHFNLGITYYRLGKYADAEASEVTAIKLNPKHASAQRIYAMATYAEGKRINSLLAWCSFLILEPQSQRSVEGFGYIHKILNHGIQKDGTNKINVSVSSNDLANLSLTMSILAATLDKKNLSPVDSLNLQLTSVFKLAGDAKDNNDSFFSNFYANFFGKMGNSDNMEAFTRFISLTGYKDENLAWFKANNDKLTKLDMWIRDNPRRFN